MIARLTALGPNLLTGNRKSLIGCRHRIRYSRYTLSKKIIEKLKKKKKSSVFSFKRAPSPQMHVTNNSDSSSKLAALARSGQSEPDNRVTRPKCCYRRSKGQSNDALAGSRPPPPPPPVLQSAAPMKNSTVFGLPRWRDLTSLYFRRII